MQPVKDKHINFNAKVLCVFKLILYFISFHACISDPIFHFPNIFSISRWQKSTHDRSLDWAEAEQLLLFGYLLIYELCICQSFCSHAFTLFVFYWRRRGFLHGGWVAGWSPPRGVGGGACLLCSLLSHFIAPSVHRRTVKLWRLSSSFLLDIWISFWCIRTSAPENVFQFI